MSFRPSWRQVPVRVALAATIAITIAGCGSAKYPSDVRKNFVTACTSKGGGTQPCNCLIDKIEKNVAFDQFKKDDQAARQSGKVPSYLAKYVGECAK